MRVSYIDNEKMINLNLPGKVWGNYWVKDSTDEEGQNIINIEAVDNKWKMTSNTDTSIIYNGVAVSEVILEKNKFYTLEDAKTKELSFVYTSEVYDKTYEYYEPSADNIVLKIGKNQDADIIFSNSNVEDINNELFYQNGKWAINDVKSRFGTYINNRREESKILENGDFVFIMGLKLIVMNKKILINNPSGQVRVNDKKLIFTPREDLGGIAKGSDLDPGMVDLYTDKEFFIRSPRFRTTFESSKMKIDEPPTKREESQKPAILVIGPMITMAMMSLSMVLPVIMQLINGETTIAKSWTRLLMSGTMLMGSLLWPVLNNRYSKKQAKLYEATRQKKYREYVDFKAQKLGELGATEKAALIDNNVSPDDCAKIVIQKNRRLWERDKNHSDFMQARLGVGNAPLSVEVESQEEKFSLEDDVLKKYLEGTIKNHSILAGVPIVENFVDKNIVAVEGRRHLIKDFMNNLIIQFTTFHSYKDLKVVILTSEYYQNDWEFLKGIPHIWSDDKKARYFATTAEEMKNISFVLEQEVKKRFPSTEENDEKSKMLQKFKENERFKIFSPYYLIITDNFKVARNLQAIEAILNKGGNYGFSLIILDENLSSAPPECKAFISIGEKTSGLFESELIANKQKIFTVDKTSFDISECVNIMANIPIEMAKGEYSLPNTISFLQMYKAGMIEQLNPVNRWKKNNPVTSLAAPVGIGTNGELFKLDLHEKFHGPHGLVAGMTGSGKSEWIITYILSMAVNFHPDEVQFVLIDYKGGGLAGAFENRETGMRLPHLTGTITNLDVSEINRSLVSINSELKRRQAMFNKARDKLGEGTIDIYKYQRYYREGALDEPISHLFIISDEFAELKAQQPEFMDELISTARIGRSLGVHLILATQKPSGVVNDQIWSNSRFRICLKVQDASDSKEMIKRPDAAGLKQAGRFYLQVGYDEFFALGQSAWAGAQYVPSSKVVKQIDDSLEFVDQTGNVIKTANNNQDETGEKKSLGEELPNIVKYISEIAEHENIHPRRLWLDKIAANIYIKDLEKKYNYQQNAGEIIPIIGEFDLPAQQQQKLLTINLKDSGNIWLVGLSNKDMFFRTLIYSIMINTSPEDINMYVLDFDTEALRVFTGAPQIGDIVTGIEEEKITNLFKMLYEEKEKRKELLKDYNGNYNYYLKTSGNKLPLITVFINSFENFYELYPKYEEEIRSFTRDCAKFGIVFILGSLAENGVRSAIRQNFSTRFALDVNDPYEYRSILTMENKIVPARGAGRGVYVFDEIGYEFQTAQFSPLEEINNVVKDTILKLKEKYTTKARKIPVLPEVVTEDLFEDKTYNNMPFGIYTESLENAYLNLQENSFVTITAEYLDSLKVFVKPFANMLEKMGINYRFWDFSKEFKNDVNADKYLTKGIGKDIEAITAYVDQVYDVYEKNNMNIEAVKDAAKMVIFFNGISQLFSEVPMEIKTSIISMIKKARELGLITFFILEDASVLKSAKYEEWYTLFVDNKQGIFVGNGIENTMVYTLSTMDRTLREQIPHNYAYIINKGKAQRLKLISLAKEENDAE